MSAGVAKAEERRSLEQMRAEHALKCVERVLRDGEREVDPASYRSYVERLGSSIVMNGLGQALATELAAAGPPRSQNPDERAHQRLYDHLHEWLCRPDGGVYPGAKDLLREMMKRGQAEYLRAQMEALAWLEWHKKFCQASLPRREEA